MRLDQFFTPADACVAAYRSWETSQEGLRIGDFACGNGSLLELAPFAKKKVFGMDIDPRVVAELRSRHPEWDIHVGDFLSPNRHGRRILNPILGTLDLVVLNPPFSCRGGTKVSVDFGGQAFACSKATAFLVRSLRFLNESGSLMAILPRSAMRSEKDAAAFGAIERDWMVEVKEEFPRTTFEGCSPHSICVSVRRRSVVSTMRRETDSSSPGEGVPSLTVTRGCIPIYTTSAAGPYPVLHTTELRQEDPIGAIRRFSPRPGRTVDGVFVTLPRVGAPDRSKVRLLEAPAPVSLSDCVFGLVPHDPRAAPALLEMINDHWERVEVRYSSTCAPYITAAQVKALVESIGWTPLAVRSEDYKIKLEAQGGDEL